MSRVLLKKLVIKNFGPINEDTITLEPFTYFIGRNNAGKSHYLHAVEILLATKKPNNHDIENLQKDKSKEIYLEAEFEGVNNFTNLIERSNHKEAIEDAISDGILKVVRVLHSTDEEKNAFGILNQDGTIHNPTGFSNNLLKILPEPISILATADTIDELKNTQNTALTKLKKEVLSTFFDELKEMTKTSFEEIDSYLHSNNSNERSSKLKDFEKHLCEEMMGEFNDVTPSVEFRLPDEEIIAKEMKIFLDDGYKSEIEQKGHGLQRTALIALLRVLAKHGMKYQSRPSPIFLIGELESFLHPYAQKQLAEILNTLVEQYQIMTTTHSPFIINSNCVSGYRRVIKDNLGTQSIAPNTQEIDISLIERHLKLRGNLEGLFADRVILVEGIHDENAFESIRKALDIKLPEKRFVLFLEVKGKEALRIARKFYKQLNFEDVSIVGDLDFIFCNDFGNLLNELGEDLSILKKYRDHIGWAEEGNPKLEYILEKIDENGEPDDLEILLQKLVDNRIFILKKGSPEMYYKNNLGEKIGWNYLRSEEDLIESDYLKDFLTSLLN